MCGTHKFMNSVQVDQVAKGNKQRVQNVKYVSIINSDVTEPSNIASNTPAIPCQACGLRLDDLFMSLIFAVHLLCL